jgi:hypothetical protein
MDQQIFQVKTRRFFISFTLCVGLCFLASPLFSQTGFEVARLKYSGGGDWYNDPSAMPNLLAFVKDKTGLQTPEFESTVEASGTKLFNYPFLFMTGHGRIRFTDEERENLKTYLTSGGFLYADDDYGMDKSFRDEMKRIFPDQPLQQLPFSHEIYHSYYPFKEGPPKIHEHDNKPPSGYGIVYDGRLVVFYTYESNPSDAWADKEIHNTPPDLRQKAFEFGTNILWYALSH